jgi:ABC-type phosphate transport system substrate-binding protein
MGAVVNKPPISLLYLTLRRQKNMNRNKLFSMASAVAVLALVLSACATPTPTAAPTSAAATQGSAATQAPENTSAPEGTTAPENTAAPQPTSEAAAGAVTLPVIDPSSVEGDIITAGSSTVFPLTERMAELFGQEGYNGNITVDSIGTGAGFERFCVTGEIDISNASRAIKGTEVEACRAIGREPLEFRVGTDALAVVVNPESPLATRGLSLDELSQIFARR